MSDLERRLARLSPQQRELLRRRLRASRGRASPEEVDGSPPPRPARIPRRSGDRGRAVLSFSQLRQWVLEQLEPGTADYNIPIGFRLEGRLDVDALSQTLDSILRRHEVLRTTFEPVPEDRSGERGSSPAADGVVQVIHPHRPYRLPVTDLGGLDRAEREAEARRLAEVDAGRPFDLEHGPLARFQLLRLGNESHVLLTNLHHIVSDGWSQGVLLRQLGELYRAFAAGAPDPLEEPEIQYADFAAWQRRRLQGPVLDEMLDYWRRQLAGAAPRLALLTDHPRPRTPDFRGAQERRLLTPPLAAALNGLARESGASLFMVVLAAFQVLLHRHTGERDVTVGTFIASRNRPEIADVIGFFVNNLALRTSLDPGEGFRQLLERVRETTLSAYQHQDLPFEKLVDELQPVRDAGSTPFFQTMCVLQNTDHGGVELEGLETTYQPARHKRSNFDLTLWTSEESGGLQLVLEYRAELFEPSTVERMLGHLEILLEAVAADPRQSISTLPMLAAGELDQLRRFWRGPSTPVAEGTVLRGFLRWAAETPAGVAVRQAGRELSYRQLADASARLARRLRAHGVGPDRVVAVALERSPELIVALLGVLRAGGAYLPLDPSYPEERRVYMIESSGAEWVITEEHRRSMFAEAAEVICLDLTDQVQESGDDAGDLYAEPDPGQLAYVIYTSGSTGRPKGVLIEHRALLHYSLDAVRAYGVESSDRLLQFASVAFDTSAEEIYPALMTGATLELRDDTLIDSNEDFLGGLDRLGITVLNLPTAFWHQMVDALESDGSALPRDLRLVIIGGEKALGDRVAAWGRIVAESAHPVRLVNTYGPTEATIVATRWPLDGGGDEPTPDDPPIGRPIGGARARVLDRRLQAVPVGVAGELCLGGPGLARGYLDRPALTAERFVPDSFAGAPGARLYRSGDLGRILGGGELEYRGRADHQVKVRGFRVELGEIETALDRHPGVGQSVVAAFTGASGIARLVAYVLPVEGAETTVPANAELRSFLAERLPEHMLPAAYVPLETLPLTATGKVDRRALPEPDLTRQQTADEYLPPSTPVEEALAKIWRDVLRTDRVGLHDNFFALGGDSILAIQLVSRGRKAGLDFSPRQIFEHPTLECLAGATGLLDRDEGAASQTAGTASTLDHSVAATALEPEHFPLAGLDASELAEILEQLGGVATAGESANNIEAIFPLTPAQQGMLLYLLLADAVTGTFFEHFVADVSGELDVAALDRAWRQVIGRHGALRTLFLWRNLERPLQVSLRTIEPSWDHVDLRGLSETAQRRELTSYLEGLRRHGFELSRAPLSQWATFRVGERRWRLVWAFSHLILDGWSVALVWGQVLAAYAALRRGELPPGLPERPFSDYVAWLERRDSAEAESYWRRTLGGLERSTRLAIEHSPASGATEDLPFERRQLALPKQTSGALVALARRLGVTPNVVFHGAWALLLGRYAGTGEVVYGGVVSGRPPEIEGVETMVGLMINAMPTRVALPDAVPLDTWLRRLQTLLVEQRQYETRAIEEIERWISWRDDQPTFEHVITYQNHPLHGSETRSIEGLELGTIDLDEQTNYPLVAYVIPDRGVLDNGVVLRLVYDPGRFDGRAVERMLDRFGRLLEGFAEDSDRRLGEISLLSGAERRQVLRIATGVPVETRSGVCLHRLFEAQASRDPGAPAVTMVGLGEQGVLTYGQLDRRARRLAHRLAAQGVGPDTVVGVSLRRSPELIVSLLGVLRAGGAYLPLDPSYPQERLSFMIEDSGARVVLTDRASRRRFGRAVVLCLEDLDLDASAESADELPSLPSESSDRHLAYVIYTSGSTGRPKGVQIEHRSIAHYALDAIRDYGIEAGDRVLQFASVSFDTSAEEIYPALLTGATLVLRDEDMIATTEDFLARLAEERISVLNLPTAFWHQMAADLDAEDLAVPPDLRLVIIGGEKALGQRLASWRRRVGDVRLVNTYGPTEATIVATRFDPPADTAGEDPPIGRPISNSRALVLDHAGRLEPAEVTGELHLGGPGLARGYLGRPALTAERFVPDADSDLPGERLYRSGDLACYRTDGQLEFRGRTDHQVKVRGFRIELGEIEAALDHHPGVHQSVVVPHRILEQAGDAGTRLVAYVVPVTSTELPAAEELRGFLATSLPDYMLPGIFTALEALPLTAGGKVDRTALPIPDLAGPDVEADYVSPSTPVERRLAEVWNGVLGRDRIGVRDNFFALGGDSILVIRLVARCRKAGLEISPRQLFEHPTLEQAARVATVLDGESVGASDASMTGVAPERSLPVSALEPAHFPLAGLDAGDLSGLLDRLGATAEAGTGNNVEAIFPLTPAQQGMLLYLLLNDATVGTFFEHFIGDASGELDAGALEQAWRHVIQRHGALRTLFAWRDLERPLQVTLRAVEPSWNRVDLRGLPVTVQRRQMAAHVEDQRRRGFELSRAPLLRLALFHLGDRRHRLIWTFSHLILDGWSVSLVWAQVLAAYAALHRGDQPAALPERPFRDYVAWLENRDAAAAEGYWCRTLEGFEQPTRLGIDHGPRPGDGRQFGLQQIALSGETGSALASLARSMSVTPSVLFYGAWALLLGRYAGAGEVVFGGVVSGRPPEIEGVETMVGLMINAMPTRVALTDSMPLEGWLRDLQTQLVAQRRHETRALEEIERWISWEHDQPIFDHLISYQNHLTLSGTDGVAIEGPEFSRIDLDEQTNFPLVAYVIPVGALEGGVLLRLVNDPSRFDGEAVDRLLGRFGRLLEAFVEEPGRRLGEISLLSADERRQVLRTATGASVETPSGVCLHQLVEAQARRDPGATAVALAGRGKQGALSYGQLDRRALRLAHRLVAMGIGPGSVVGVSLHRSPGQIVSLLGVLRAGGAYLPLDPSYPEERLAFMIEDSKAWVVLTDRASRQRFGCAEVLCLEELDAEPDVADDSLSLPVELSDRNLAYVIYTSGSTGRPKGVQVEHRAIVHYALDAVRDYGIEAGDRVLQFASVNFDTSAEEIYPALLTGATLVLRDDDMLATTEDFLARLASERISVLNLPTAFWHQMAADLDAEDLAVPPSLRLVIIGGEKALGQRLASWQRRAGDVRLVNTYGPTEATIVATRFDPPAGPAAQDPPIGRPIANCRALVLDHAGRLGPAEATGELHLGGPGLARGYLGHPALTAERFVPDAVSGQSGERLYRSGDLACYRTDGQIEYRGRTDHQIKVRGYRIELGEIEATFDRHPGVHQSIVVALQPEQPAAGGTRLVAYVVAPRADAAPSVKELLGFAAETLPDYMLPTAVTVLDALPLTASGKVDRAALPIPDLDGHDPEADFAPPSTPAEQRLAEIWRGVLGRERIGIHDSFFALGGDSILALTLVARSRKAGLDFSPRALFEAPTIAELARLAVAVESTVPVATPAPEESGNAASGPEILPESGLSTNDLEDLFAEIGATD